MFTVHQSSVLSTLLFIIVLEALSHEFCCGIPWEGLYADDLVIIAEWLEECVRRLLTWKEEMEEKGLRVNARKTKIMICGMRLDLLQGSGEFPYAVCRTGVGSNSIFCKGCKHWVHKVADHNFGCATFCALPSFGAVTTFFSHTTVSSLKVSVKDSDIDMCSAIYFLFSHNTKYCTTYLCPHTVIATV